MKKGFVLYADKYEPIKLLTMEQRGVLFTAIYAYECGDELPEMDDMTKMLFTIFKTTLDENAQRYAETCERRREAGRQGGLAKASKSKQMLANASKSKQNVANLADNDNENDNDNDIKEKDIKRKQQKHKYGSYENVLLSDEDMTKLKTEFPGDWQERIDKLSEYMRSTGKSYKDHLATIRSWAKRDKEKPMRVVKENSFHNFKQRTYTAEDYKKLMEANRKRYEREDNGECNFC